jgi:hypothetical protein
MKKSISVIFSLILLCMATIVNAADNTNITYTVSFAEAQAHYADVEMKITGLKQNTLELKMPVWTPGSYLVREFAKNIETLSVTGNGKPLLNTAFTLSKFLYVPVLSMHRTRFCHRLIFFYTPAICCMHLQPYTSSLINGGRRYRPV